MSPALRKLLATGHYVTFSLDATEYRVTVRAKWDKDNVAASASVDKFDFQCASFDLIEHELERILEKLC